jgi:PleD family two-component response regulator
MVSDLEMPFIVSQQTKINCSAVKAFLFEGIHKPLSFSCGLLYVDQEKTQFNDGTELVRYVDRLLYKAKETGKNRIVSDEGEYFFSSI